MIPMIITTNIYDLKRNRCVIFYEFALIFLFVRFQNETTLQCTKPAHFTTLIQNSFLILMRLSLENKEYMQALIAICIKDVCIRNSK